MNPKFRRPRREEPDTSPLIDETEVSVSVETSCFGVRQIRFVEPLPALYIAAAVTLEPVLQQYTYLRISQQLGNNNTNTSDSDQILSICNPNKSSPAYQIQQQTQSLSSRFFMYLTVVQVLLSCLPIILLGNIMDLIGRKIAFYLTFSTRVFYAVTLAFVIGYNLPLWVFFIAHALDGLSGSIAAAMMAFNTYISDVTEPGNERGFRMTVLEAVIGITAGVSVLATGFLIKETNFLVPVFIALGFLFLGLFYSVFILAESYKPEKLCQSLRQLNCEIWQKNFAHYIWDTPERRRSRLILALIGLILTAPTIIASMDVVVLYVLNLPFCWSSAHLGTFSAAQTFGRWLFSLTIVKLLQRYLSGPGLVIVGNFSNFVSHIVLAFAKQDGMIYISASVGALAYIGLPNIRSTMSKLVRKDEQGALFAGISFLEALSVMIFEILFNSIYAWTLPIMPGIVFFIISGMLLLTIFIFVGYEYLSRKIQKELNSLSIN